MLCQSCQKKTASVHFTKIINNKKVEMFLCKQCADEQGDFNFNSAFNINDFFSGLINFPGSAQYIHSAVPQDSICDGCGMSYEDFRRIGKLGCSKCYTVFGQRLDALIRRLHGNVEHHGKVPAKVYEEMRMSNEINKLKEQLNAAVQNEQYEKAAQLRDEIRRLEALEK